MSPFPFKPYSQLTPTSLLDLCPAVITMARRVLMFCDITKALAGPQSPDARADKHTGASSSLLTMRSVILFFFWFLCVSSFCAFVFYCLRDDTIELPGKVPCGRHFQSQQNLPEHDRGWLGSKLHWLLLLIVLFVIQTFPGDSDESTVQTLPALQGSSLGSSGKKKKKASPDKDYTLDALNQLEMDLVMFVARVRNLKLAMATVSKLSLPSLEEPADTHNNITTYELWDNEDFDEDSE